jgi:hypothetical protein
MLFCSQTNFKTIQYVTQIRKSRSFLPRSPLFLGGSEGRVLSAGLGQALSDYPPLSCRCRSRARASLRNRVVWCLSLPPTVEVEDHAHDIGGLSPRLLLLWGSMHRRRRLPRLRGAQYTRWRRRRVLDCQYRSFDECRSVALASVAGAIRAPLGCFKWVGCLLCPSFGGFDDEDAWPRPGIRI